jgi:hypothetical protein
VRGHRTGEGPDGPLPTSPRKGSAAAKPPLGTA